MLAVTHYLFRIMGNPLAKETTIATFQFSTITNPLSSTSTKSPIKASILQLSINNDGEKH